MLKTRILAPPTGWYQGNGGRAAGAVALAVLLSWPSGFGTVCCCSGTSSGRHEHRETQAPSAVASSHDPGGDTHAAQEHHVNARSPGPVVQASQAGECPPWPETDKGVSTLGLTHIYQAFLHCVPAASPEPPSAIPWRPALRGFWANAPPRPSGVPVLLLQSVSLT